MKTTHLIIALNLFVFAVMLAIGGAGEIRHFSSHTLLQFGSLYAPLVREGQVWRMFTATFMHIDPIHIAMNMVALYQVGNVLEPHYGRGRFVALYLVSGLAGSAVSLAWHFTHPVNSAGASGAISGLIGAAVVAGHLMGGPEARHFRDAMLRWAAIVMVYGALTGADNAAHAGGLVAGAAIAWLLDSGGRAARRKPRPGSLGLEAVVLIGLVAGSFALAAQHRESAVTVEELVNGGVDLAKAGKDSEAMVLYRRALAMEPRNAIARFDLALALLRQRDFPAAVAEARESTILQPGHKESWAVLGEALAGQGKPAEAAEAYKRYTELGGKMTEGDPPDPDGGTP